MTANARVRLSPDASVAELDGEAVVLHVKSGRFFRVNRFGTPLLAALQREAGASREELVASLVTAFRAEPARAGRNVEAWLELLRKAGLLADDTRESDP